MTGQPPEFSAIYGALNGQDPVEAVRRLIVQWGANARDKEGATVLQHVLERVRALDQNKRSKLWAPLIDMLVAEGVETEVPHSKSGEPLLIHALRRQHVEAVEMLLDMSADHAVCDPSTGETAHAAATRSFGIGSKAPQIQNAYGGVRDKADTALRLLNLHPDPLKMLFVTGSDGKQRLSADGRLLCEYGLLESVAVPLHSDQPLTRDEIFALMKDAAALMPERYRDRLRLDVSGLLRESPLEPGTPIKVEEYIRGGEKAPELKV